MLVSFLGSLPLGTLNVAAMQISITDGIHPALLFAIGSLLVEIVYVRASLVAMDWVRRQERLFKFLEWITLLIVLALAASSFYSAWTPSVKENIILSSTLPRFWLGVTMSALNPVQIPFWFGWSTVLFAKKILQPKYSHYNTYIIGIGLGTLAGNSVFIFGGQFAAQHVNSNRHILDWVIGGIFFITAIIQGWRMYNHKDALHQLEHPEEITHGLENKIDL